MWKADNLRDWQGAPAHAAPILVSVEQRWPEIAPNTPFLPDVPVANCLKTNHRLLCFFHGMEEVVGSIPTRSTISFDHLQIPLSSLAPHGVRTL